MSTVLSAKLDADCYAAEPLEVKCNVQDGNTMHVLSSLLLSTLTEVQADKCLSAGQKITDYLRELSPDERSKLISNTQVQHYLHRLVQHAEKTATQNEITEKIAEYFPNEVAYFKGKKLPFSYSHSDKEPSDSESIMTDSRRTAGCHAHLFQYRANALAATFRGPQLKLEDIRRASTAVAIEVTKLEKKMNSKDIGPPKRSLSVGVHGHVKPPTRLLRFVRSSKKSMAEIPMLVPVLRSELSDPHFRASKSGASLFPPKRRQSPLPLQTAPVSVNGVPLLNAFDVIEAFASGQLESEAESVYLNFSHSNHCSPYDLTVTLRTKVEPEHFVISNFGIIHVYPDGMSDFQSFADWLREASMFTLMRQIPFFKEFKLKRALWQWHKAVKSTKFLRLTLKIDRICIRFFPLYADALSKLQHLSEELMTISFHDLKPLGSYTVDAMEHSLQGSQTKAHQLLLKYFKYCRRIVCGTISSSRKHASDLETEHHHQLFVPEVPLSIQRRKHEMLERDLKAATYQGERIADFVFLAEQLVYNCLLQLARWNADSWKKVFLSPILKQASSGFQIPMPSNRQNIGSDKSRKSEQNQDNYFLLSSLEINDESGELITEPKSSQIKGLFCTFFSDISDIISATVHQLDVPPQEKEKLLTRGSTRDSCTYHTASPQMQPANKRNSLSSNSCKDSKKRLHDIPPSLVPVRQKSVVKALRGVPHDSNQMVSLALGEQHETLTRQAEQTLQGLAQQSEKARDLVPNRRNSVLHKDVFAEMLQNDEYLQHVLKEVETATNKVSVQLESICQEFSWLSDVWEFVRLWKGGQCVLADEFEVTLNQLYKWQNQFVALPPEILTPYALLCISSSGLVEKFQSTLENIQDQVKSGAIHKSRQLCERVLEETKRRTEILLSKRYDLEGFAEYAHNLRECHVFQAKECDNITYVLKIHNILQRLGIGVPKSDKELGRELREVWSSFELKLAEGDGFVAKQTPIKAQGLQESIRTCEEELHTLVGQVDQGDFVDPEQDPNYLIELLDGIRVEVSVVHSRLLGLSKWKEAITGVSHDLSNVNSLLDRVHVRQELWKYRRVFDGYEKQWMNMPFNTLDVNFISSKVTDWLEVCTKLLDTLAKDDPVSTEWRERLDRLKRGIPLLKQLSSKYLKVSHWVTVFAALGEEYDSSQHYTLTDLALYNIYDHTEFIFEICYDAMQGERLKAKVLEIQQQLAAMKVNVIQLPLEFYPLAGLGPLNAESQTNIRTSTSGKRRLKSVDAPATKKGASFALNFMETSSSPSQYLYTIDNHAAILMELENYAIQLKCHLDSPHMGIMRLKTNNLLDTISQLLELVHLLTQCQEKWEHLLSLVKLTQASVRREINIVEDLQKASDKFQEITMSIHDDPRLLSLVDKRRGQKGFRELQGESLRLACNSVFIIMNTVQLKLRDLMDKAIESFPRLCYVSERELLTVMGTKGNPVPILPIISSVFPAIDLVRFTEIIPSKPSATTTASNDEEGFQILFVKDCHKQQLSLCVPLFLGRRPATEWLNGLEYAISYSLASALSETYLNLPALLKGMEVLTERLGIELLLWLSKHLNQCVLLSMELHWTLVLHFALTSDLPVEQLRLASTKVASASESISEVLLRGNIKRTRPTNLLLQQIILILRQKAELTQSLLAEGVCSVESIHWRSQIQYSTETEDLYTVPDLSCPSSVKRVPATYDLSAISSSHTLSGMRSAVKGHSPVHCVKAMNSNSLVGSSMSSVLAKNTPANITSNVCSHDLNRSQVTPGFHAIGVATSPLRCFIHCYKMSIPYGFEFLGAEDCLSLAPRTESALLSLVHALASHEYPSIKSNSATTGKDLAVALGRHLHIVDCCVLTDAAVLRRLLFGAIHTGSLLQINNVHHLPPLLAIELGVWLGMVSKVLTKIPSFAEKQAQLKKDINVTSSVRSTPGLPIHPPLAPPPSQRDTCLIIQDSPCSHTTTDATHNLRSIEAPSSTVISRQSSRLLPSQMLNLGNRSYYSGHTSTRTDWYQLEGKQEYETWFGYGAEARRHVEADKSTALHFSLAFGCIFGGDISTIAISEQLKSCFRSVDVVQPELTYLSEALLVSHGFSAAQDLSCTISRFLQQLKHQLSSSEAAVSSSIGAFSLRHIVQHAAQLLLEDNNSRLGFNIESKCIVKSILHFFATQLTTGLHSDEDEDMDEGNMSVDTTSWNKLKELLGSFFPSCDIDYSYPDDDTSPVPNELLEAIKTQLQERHLQCLASLMEKIKQLHLMLSLQGSKCVILTGPSGSGKSTCLKILTAAYQQVRDIHTLAQKSWRMGSTRGSEECTYPTVNTVVINPGAYTMDELFGSNIDGGGQSSNLMWHDGILTSILRNIKSSDGTRAVTMHPDLNYSASQAVAESGAPVRNWIVLDGLTPLVAETLHRLLADDGITLKNGETLSLPKSCQLIVECPTLSCASPSLLSFSSILHYGGDTLSYSALVDTWLERAPTQHNLSLISAETLATMIRELLPETLEYLENVATKHHGAEYTMWSRSQVHGLTETQCFLSLLSAVLERNSPKDDSGLSYTASGSHSSRGNSTTSDSRASSTVMKSYSAISVQSEVSSEHFEQPPMASKYNIPPMVDVDNMSEVSNLDIELSLSLQVQMAAMLAFAYIWSLGAFVPFSEVASFSELARDLIMQLPYAVPLPDDGSVFDYFLDLKIYHFLPWAERKSENRKSSNHSGYIALPELERFVYIADLYISYGFDVILTGERGTGRTSFVENLLRSRLSLDGLPVSHLLTPVQLQVAIKEKLVQLEKKSGQRFLTGSRRNVQKHAFFLDDIHLADMEGSTSAPPSTGCRGHGCQDCPVLELLRYMLCHHKLTDFTRCCYEHLLSSKFVFTSTPDDYWRLPVRFTRTMCRLPFLPPSDKCLHSIFSCTVSPWLEGFPLEDASLMANALSAASVTVHQSVSERFCPSSLRPHFLITIRHLLSVFEGLLLLSPDTKVQARPQFGFLNRRGFQSGKTSQKNPDSKLKNGRKSLPSISGRKSLKRRSTVASKEVEQTEADSTLRMLIRLWSHETTRVYLDRNIDSKERMWFLKLMETCIKYCFCGVSFEENFGGAKERGLFRPSGGHTANLGGRCARGNRGRGGSVPQASVSDSLNAEELARNGVKVETLKQLLAAAGNTTEERKDIPGGKTNQNPPKLISLDQVTVRGEDLTGLIFAQFPSPISSDDSNQLLSAESASAGLNCPNSTPQLPPAGYAELGDGQVMDVLSKHLESFQSSRGRDCDDDESLSSSTGHHTDTGGITLYKDAIEHCARLYRVLNLPGAHALLLGSKGAGRKTLLRLMAYIKKSNVIKLHSGQHDLKQSLREACISAGLDMQHTLLVVSNHSHFSFQEWNIIVTVMSEGLSPGLFTSSELLVMSGKMHAGKMKRTAQIAYQAFSRAVSMQLHVFVLWDLDSVTGSLFSAQRLHQADGLTHEASLRALFQSIYQQCAYVDHYQPWSKHAYSEIAMQWWQKESSAVKWQEWTETSSQLETISSLAAHVHIVTSELLIQVYGELGRHLVTPKLFIECLTMTQNIAIRIKEKEKAGVVHLEAALAKLNAVNKVETELKERLISLRPQLIYSEKEVQDKMHLITSAKERYMEANRRCKVAEETIEYETSNVQRLSLLVENKMAEVTPIYQAAIETLSAVKLNDVLEIMKYREPPSLLNPLFNALCMLFDREESWEECQQLLMTSKFLESLRFFDRDNVARHKICKLEKMIGETTKFESIKYGSKATVSLSKWLHALVDYHNVTMAIEPLKKELAIAEETLTNAKRTFVAMQKDMLETKVALENTIKQHKDSIKQSRRIENGIQSLGVDLSDAQGVVNALAIQRNKWEERLSDISSRISSVPGHAMLCAAGVLYLSRSPPDRHKEMLNNWLGYCSGVVPLGSLKVEQNKLQSAQGYGAFSGQQQVVRIQKDFSLAACLSEKEERSVWNQESTFPDESILDRYLSSRALCTLGSAAWPLVFDPYNQLQKYLKVSGDINNSEVHALGLSDPSLMDELRMAVMQGSTILLYMDDDTSAVKYSEEDTGLLARLLRRDFDKSAGEDSLFDTAANPSLQVYMVIRGTISSVQGSDGTMWLNSLLKIPLSLDSYVIDIELKEAALEKNLLNVVIAHERPDHQISYKSLLTDLALHEDELEANKERMLKYVLDTKNDSLLFSKDLLGTISKCEAAELAAQEQVHEARKNLRVSSQKVVPYKSLSQYAGCMLRSIQKISSILHYFSLGVNDFERILTDVISKYKSTKVSDNTLSIKAHVIHLKCELMLRVYQKLQMRIFEKHQLLFPLLVALETKQDQGEVTPRELELLGRNIGGLDSQLDLAGKTNMSNLASKPTWVTDKSWCKALKIQKEIVAFGRLCTEVSGSSTEWREYFEMPPCIMAPVPGFGRNCSMCQKILLWKVFKPDKFYAVIKDFILVTAGDDFIKTNSHSLEEILAETKPATLTLLLQSPDSPDNSLSMAVLRETALYLHIEHKHFCAEGCNGVLHSLPLLASRNCWVVLEYCHLLPNCHELLVALERKLKVLGKCASQFHVWVLMPAQHISKCPISGCKMMTFQSPKISNIREQSIQMLQDFEALLTSTSDQRDRAKQELLISHQPTISKLKAFLPPVLSELDLMELDPQHSSLHALPSLIYRELQVHNQHIVWLHASLELVSSFLESKVPFTASIGTDVMSVAADVIPPSWTGILPKPLSHMTSLMSAVKLLKARVVFYKRTLQSGTLASKLNPLLFSTPQDLISSRACSFALECQLSVSGVMAEGKLHAGELLERHTNSLVLFGLSLCSATWDRHHSCLSMQHTDDSLSVDKDSYCAVISFRLGEESALSTPTPDGRRDRGRVLEEEGRCLFDCPVLLTNRNTESNELYFSKSEISHSPLFHVPLALSAELLESIVDKVYLSCDSEYHDAYM